jgi:hypothetical protein
VVAMKRFIYVIACILFLIPATFAADTGIFYILDEKFINNISELPPSSGTPDIVWQQSGHIKAWIDIVGFNKMMQENGVNYVPGNPTDYAIVQYDAKFVPYDCPTTCSVEYLKHSISVYASGNTTVAQDDIELKWATIYVNCDEGGCWSNTVYTTEHQVFLDTESSPLIYQPIRTQVSITQYNNSIYENIGISISNTPGLFSYIVEYHNETALHNLKVAHVEQTAKGIYFANISSDEFWKINGTNISRVYNTVFMNGNISKMNISDIKITASTLYETVLVNPQDYKISRVEFKPENELHNTVLITVMGAIGIMLTIGGILINRW